MLIEQTMEKMLSLRLPTMVSALRELYERPGQADLSFEEKLGLLVDREWMDRENKRMNRRLKDARLPVSASLEDMQCDPSRGLDKAAVRSLAQCHWVTGRQNVIIVGATGVGKTYFGAALAEAACRHGYRALHVRVPRLVHDLGVWRADGSYTQQLARLGRIDVIVLDDFLLSPMTDAERRDLLEVLEDRYDRASTVIMSQIPTKTWHEALGDPTVADAICDRLVHNAHIFVIKGASMRQRKGLGTAQQTQP